MCDTYSNVVLADAGQNVHCHQHQVSWQHKLCGRVHARNHFSVVKCLICKELLYISLYVMYVYLYIDLYSWHLAFKQLFYSQLYDQDDKHTYIHTYTHTYTHTHTHSYTTQLEIVLSPLIRHSQCTSGGIAAPQSHLVEPGGSHPVFPVMRKKNTILMYVYSWILEGSGQI